MSNSQNPNFNRIPLIDYIPASLKKGKKGNWIIEFYVMNPLAKKLKRIRRRVKPISNTRERERFAKHIVVTVNDKLRCGWNPITEKEGTHSFILIQDVLDTYLNQIQKQVKDGTLRSDTMRSYKSQVNTFSVFLKNRPKEDQFCVNFDRKLIVDFLDHIYYERDNGTASYNNYLGAMVRIGNYMADRGYIKINDALKIQRKEKTIKTRIVIPPVDRKIIFEHLLREDPGFGVFCMMEYYELLRPTEMTKMKVGDLSIINDVIYIRKEVSKTKREATLRILKEFRPYLIDHIKKANNSDWLFSNNNYLPGPKQLPRKKFTATWNALRDTLNLDKKYQLYSLKDTGITDMLNAGIPAIVVRDHARHADLSMTNKYVAVAKGVDPEKINNKIKF